MNESNKNAVTGQLHILPTDRKPDELELVNSNSTTSKRHYEKMTITKTEIEMEQCILAGSITKVKIEVGDVSVKSFESDTDFPSDGFDVSFD